MSCRCNDIRQCNRDISKLCQIIDRIQRLSGGKNALISIENEICSIENEAYELNGQIRGSIKAKLTKNEAEFDEAIHEYVRYLDGEVEQLESELRYMEQEDEDYHNDDDDC